MSIDSDNLSQISRNETTGDLDELRAEWFEFGRKSGKREEQERIIKMLEEHLGYGDAEWDSSVMAIIALIKGEQKKIIHTHEIEVFGSPCDCGTRHEYCGDCDWVEPCESEGEQK